MKTEILVGRLYKSKNQNNQISHFCVMNIAYVPFGRYFVEYDHVETGQKGFESLEECQKYWTRI